MGLRPAGRQGPCDYSGIVHALRAWRTELSRGGTICPIVAATSRILRASPRIEVRELEAGGRN
jgi:hypothetical protein